MAYVLSNWGCYHEYDENQKELENIIGEIRNNIMIPQTKMISANIVHDLKKYIFSEFKYFEPVLSGNSIKIMFLNHEHREFSGIYSSNFHVSGYIRDKVFVFTAPKGGPSPVFAVLHEMGHLLSTRITKSYHGLLESFEHIVVQLIPYDERRENFDYELFANLFAEAVLIDSPFQSHKMFKDIHEDNIRVCKVYFNLLFEHVTRT